MRLKLGLEVGYFRISYLRGEPRRFFECGYVEIIRKDTVVVKVRGYEREVPKKDLHVRNMQKPRRDMRGWIPLE